MLGVPGTPAQRPPPPPRAPQAPPVLGHKSLGGVLVSGAATHDKRFMGRTLECACLLPYMPFHVGGRGG